jgi:hypothetical protein
MTYLPTTIFFDTRKNLTNQMVHILPIIKTTLVIVDMSKLTCPKWRIGLFDAYSNWEFFTRFDN